MAQTTEATLARFTSGIWASGEEGNRRESSAAIEAANEEFARRVGDHLAVCLSVLADQRDEALTRLHAAEERISREIREVEAKHDRALAVMLARHQEEIEALRAELDVLEQVASSSVTPRAGASSTPTPQAATDLDTAGTPRGARDTQALLERLEAALLDAEAMRANALRLEAERDDLLRDADEKRLALANELEAARDEAARLQSELDETTALLAAPTLELKTSGLREKIDEVNAENDELRANLRQLEREHDDALRAADDTRVSLTAELEAARDETIRLQSELDEVRDLLQATELERDSRGLEIEEAHAESQSLRSTAEQAQGERDDALRAADDIRVGLTAELEAARDEAIRLQSELDGARDLLQAERDETIRLQSELDGARDLPHAAEIDPDRRDRELEELRQKLNHVRDEADVEIFRLSEALHETRRRLEDCRKGRE